MALQHDGQYIKVALEEQGKLAIITIDNPPANALGRACMEELNDVIRAFGADDTAKIAILTGDTEAGTGMIFVAGAGMPVVPLAMADEMGLDVVLQRLEAYEHQFGPRFTPAPLLRQKVAAGELGKKSGRGFMEHA